MSELMYTNYRKYSQLYNSPCEKGEHVKFHVQESHRADHHCCTHSGSQWRWICGLSAYKIQQYSI